MQLKQVGALFMGAKRGITKTLKNRIESFDFNELALEIAEIVAQASKKINIASERAKLERKLKTIAAMYRKLNLSFEISGWEFCFKDGEFCLNPIKTRSGRVGPTGPTPPPASPAAPAAKKAASKKAKSTTTAKKAKSAPKKAASKKVAAKRPRAKAASKSVKPAISRKKSTKSTTGGK